MDLGVNSRRSFFSKIAGMAAVFAGASKLFAQQSPAAGAAMPEERRAARGAVAGPATTSTMVSYYFSGIGSNDGYPHDDHVTVTDPFDKHVTRTMDALKKSVERAGSNMDSIMDLHVFICLPIAEGVPVLTGKARFDAYKAQYDGLNKIYRTYFSPGKAPARCCMALDWIPGDSLVEMVGTALVVNPITPVAGE